MANDGKGGEAWAASGGEWTAEEIAEETAEEERGSGGNGGNSGNGGNVNGGNAHWRRQWTLDLVLALHF